MNEESKRNRNAWGNQPLSATHAIVVCPCKGCTKRSPECHGSCAEYAAYKNNVAAAKIAIGGGR